MNDKPLINRRRWPYRKSGHISARRSAMTNVTDLRHILAEHFAQLGMKQIAYVKPIVVNGSACFAINAQRLRRLAVNT
jgi:hypothetical protein